MTHAAAVPVPEAGPVPGDALVLTGRPLRTEALLEQTSRFADDIWVLDPAWLRAWADARRLLNDDTLPTPDRVAGLLLILYAQKIATISQLTVDDVHIDGDTVSITFGSSPVVLPAPLASLVLDLVATRRGKAKIGIPNDVPWLFPGGRPGHPLGDDRIGQRLHKIGIQPRQDRSTALFTLATEVPAAILARMLGVHIKVAVQWQLASGGDWAAYAPDVSSRTHP
ncbi:hypothetical protein [Streptomyces sp. NPDC057582]|uniref:hypothetical protein n=1 Tax=Streptomyces sp. NPDC057582 TaxID=3346174 RepID=UPI00367E3B7A